MNVSLKVKFAGMLLSAVAMSGCKPADSGSAATVMPTTMMAPETNGNPGGALPTTLPVPPAGQTEVIIPASTPPAAKDLTHVLEKDQPFFLNEPGASPKPVGILKAGTKVLVLIPGAEYSQVITETGVSAYTATDGLKALGK